jgi:hypothetical protein
MFGGSESDYTLELADRICELLAKGMTLRAVCREPDMPHESTVRHWALEDREGFFEKYSKAREIGYHCMADEMLEISDDGTNDWMGRFDGKGRAEIILNGEHVQRSKLRVDSRKWLLSKALPKIYGDKVQHTGAGGEGPVKVVIEPADAGIL